MQPVHVGQDLVVVDFCVNAGRDGPAHEDEQEVEAEQGEAREFAGLVRKVEEGGVREDGGGKEVAGKLLEMREGG